MFTKFSLQGKISFFVPATTNVDQIITDTELLERISTVERILSQLFGGVTTFFNTSGAWVSDNGQLVKEETALCQSYIFGNTNIASDLEILANFADKLALQWGQEVIMFTFESVDNDIASVVYMSDGE